MQKCKLHLEANEEGDMLIKISGRDVDLSFAIVRMMEDDPKMKNAVEVALYYLDSKEADEDETSFEIKFLKKQMNKLVEILKELEDK